MNMTKQENEYNGFVDNKQVECVISYNKDKDMFELLHCEEGEIVNKYYSIRRTAMETIAKVLTKWKE